MNRRYFLLVVGLVAIVGTSAAAASYEDSVVDQLKSQGYNAVTVERTLLGRIKIVGVIDTGRREIILNPRTGEILRDLWLAKSGGSNGPKIRSDSESSGKSDDNNDEIDHDEPEEDNSGEGGGDDDN